MYYNDFVSNIYVGDDSKLHKVQGGADTVLPFSSGLPVECIATCTTFKDNGYNTFYTYLQSDNIIVNGTNITCKKSGIYNFIGVWGNVGSSNSSSCYVYKNSSAIHSFAVGNGAHPTVTINSISLNVGDNIRTYKTDKGNAYPNIIIITKAN